MHLVELFKFTFRNSIHNTPHHSSMCSKVQEDIVRWNRERKTKLSSTRFWIQIRQKRIPLNDDDVFIYSLDTVPFDMNCALNLYAHIVEFAFATCQKNKHWSQISIEMEEHKQQPPRLRLKSNVLACRLALESWTNWVRNTNNLQFAT
jgi:hypothetical protein